ncbi:MAG: tRNA uridine-5-carboxymethylaminomethyl(34) synthesis GTPase MnmE [Spirochaetes bacterium]|jgi:tRNA modification GTPase|nr:tRNA uridine-5-carboxymethylaminomethyl(34) synthesis GTPase MnmE [Spirochaetota bacterium]
MLEDTICAPATPPINSTLAIIRISGPDTLGTVNRIFTRPEKILPRSACYGSIIDRDSILDDVILVYYPAPGSFTGEEMAEIFCHGNQIIVRGILNLLCGIGIRMAEPGEFSKRAFLSGKIDLTEAEAINHIITARSEWEIHTAISQMHGSMKKAVGDIRDRLLLFKSDIEACIDFSDQDLEFINRSDAVKAAVEIKGMLTSLLKKCRIGEKLSHGIDITITGKPNVGKSSILNLILNQERAIVSDIPGTTRDVIREPIQIAGFHVNLLDTAGIAKPSDDIEKIGVGLSRKKINSAAIVLMVLDSTTGIEGYDSDLIKIISGKQSVFIINKTDLTDESRVRGIIAELGRNAIAFSAKTGAGLEELEAAIANILKAEFVGHENSFIADTRIITLLEKSRDGISKIETLLGDGEPDEITAFEIQALLNTLGDITGEITPDEILDSIFSRFCIGK